MLLASLDGSRNISHVIRDFRDQDHIRATSDARTQRQPARAMSHDLRDDDAMMAMRRAVQAINRNRSDAKRGIESDRRVSQREIVINRLGQRDDVQPFFHQPQCVLVRAAAAQTNKCIQLVTFVSARDHIPHIADTSVDFHPMRLIAPCAEQRSTHGKNSCESFLVELDGVVLRETAKAVAKADDLHARIMRGLADASDGCVETWAVAACGKDSDSFGHRMILKDSTTNGHE